MARLGFSCKELSTILDVSPSKATQATEPAIEKIARLWRADATRTVSMILDKVESLEPMSEIEFELRRSIQMGRADPSQTKP